MSVFWAGKRLDDDEEVELRRLIALLHRTGEHETAESLQRFLPENDHRWTPNELETAVQMGPWMLFGAQVAPGDQLETP